MSVSLHLVQLVMLLTVFPILAMLFTVFLAQRCFQNHQRQVYSVDDRHGVEILESVSIGGIKQWIHIRGRNKDNPILLYLHGGPGWPHIGWYDAIQRPWENHFTVIQWDQRQTGKSYQSMKSIGHTISHQQYRQDAEEMIAFLRNRFSVEKIFLMGTSYGSYLGMHMVKKRPEWFYAYVGVGQVVAIDRHIKAEYELLLAYAKEHDQPELADKIETIKQDTDPDNPAKSFYKNSSYLMDQASRIGKAYCKSLNSMFSIVSFEKWVSPHYTLKDNFYRKFGSSHDASHPFAKEFMQYNLPKEIGSSFEVPIFFFTGSHDYHVAFTVTDQWFKSINAPFKEQIWFHDSAHVPFQTEPAAFAAALINHVLPMASDAYSIPQGSIRFE